MILKTKNNMKYFTFEELESLENIVFAVSTREGGVSTGCALGTLNMGTNTDDSMENIKENYIRFFSAMGLDAKKCVLAKQTHSDVVRKVTSKDLGKGIFKERDYDNVDALITNEKGIPLVIHTADCVPVTLIDKKANAIGNAHCGWRGTFSCLAEKTLKEMEKEYGTLAKDVIAVIGPSIHKCCYEVSEDLYDKFYEKFGYESAILKEGGKFFLDLQEINRLTLEKAGVKNILVSSICTCCNSDILYSHRGLGAGRGVFSTVVCLT